MFKTLKITVGIIIAISSLSNAVAENTIQKQIEANLYKRTWFSGNKQTQVSIVERMAETRLAGASVAVINNGKLDWAAGYGIANSKTNAKVDTETLFQAGSISKPVAALAALKLVEEGKISLDEDVNTYLKDWQVTGSELSKDNPVTLRQLLTHTAGLTVHGFPGYGQQEELPNTTQVLQGEGNTHLVEVDESPGSEWRYSGGGYTVMQKVVEDITGQSFADYTDKHILQAMGMTRSTYQHHLPPELKANASGAFDRRGKMYDTVYNNYPEKAAAGLWTTPTDLANYVLHMQEIIKGKTDGILKKATVEAMFEFHQNNWGLGPQMFKEENDILFGHGGKNLGFTNNFRAYVNRGDGLVIMTNGDSGGDLIQELMITISEHYRFDIAKKRLFDPVELDDSQRQAIAGRYKMLTDIGWTDGGDFIMEITHQEGDLLIDDPFVTKPQRIIATSELAFVNEITTGDFVFRKNDKQDVVGLIINEHFELRKL